MEISKTSFTWENENQSLTNLIKALFVDYLEDTLINKLLFLILLLLEKVILSKQECVGFVGKYFWNYF